MAALTFHNFTARARFADLDGLRAIAVLAVVWSHTYPHSFTGTLAGNGHHGVTLFFAISGFLITSLILRENSRYGRVDLAAFYARRALRIFPLYFGTLAVYVILVRSMESESQDGKEFFENLKYYLTYTSNLFVPIPKIGERTIFYFAWSLATEEQFYLIWPPALMLFASTLRSAWILALAIAAGWLAIETASIPFRSAPYSLALGALSSLLLHQRASYEFLAPIIGSSYAPPLIATFVLITLSTNEAPDFLIHLLAALLVSTCVIQDSHGLKALLNLSPITYIGTISYGVYMLHMLCKNLSDKIIKTAITQATDSWTFPLTVVLSVVLATVSFRYYESIFLRAKKKYERQG